MFECEHNPFMVIVYVGVAGCWRGHYCGRNAIATYATAAAIQICSKSLFYFQRYAPVPAHSCGAHTHPGKYIYIYLLLFALRHSLNQFSLL